MKKLIGITLALALAGSVFAATTKDTDSAQYGWQRGKSAQEERSAFYSKVGKYKTEAEREAAFAAAGIGGDGPYSDKEHLDVESLLARGLITQEQADKIKADASAKHGEISAAYKNADFDNMTKSQIPEFYKNLKSKN